MTQSKQKEEFLIKRTKKLLVVWVIPTALCMTLLTGFIMKSLSEDFKWWVICLSIMSFAMAGALIGKFVRKKAKKDIENVNC